MTDLPHETFDSAQNFGVPYSIFDRQSSLRQISVDAIVADARRFADDISDGRILKRSDKDAMDFGQDWPKSTRSAAEAVAVAPDDQDRREALIRLLDSMQDAKRNYGFETGLPRSSPEPVQEEGNQ
jgi:hypothetical protein